MNLSGSFATMSICRWWLSDVAWHLNPFSSRHCFWHTWQNHRSFCSPFDCAPPSDREIQKTLVLELHLTSTQLFTHLHARGDGLRREEVALAHSARSPLLSSVLARLLLGCDEMKHLFQKRIYPKCKKCILLLLNVQVQMLNNRHRRSDRVLRSQCCRHALDHALLQLQQ